MEQKFLQLIMKINLNRQTKRRKKVIKIKVNELMSNEKVMITQLIKNLNKKDIII